MSFYKQPQITATANHSARTFTIRKNGTKYRTLHLDAEEFQSCLNNTANDWNQFLTATGHYYRVN